MKKIAHWLSVVGLGLGVFGAVGTVGTFGVARADNAAGAKSRADVVAELQAARSSGELDALAGEDSGSFYLSRQRVGNSVSRQQVLANAVASHRSSQVWMHGEDSGSFVLSGTPAAAGARYAGPDAGETQPARIASTK